MKLVPCVLLLASFHSRQASATACQQISVAGDATYCITGPQVCIGSGAAPSGTNCPKRGDRAVANCLSYLPSFSNALSTPNNPICEAPYDATCSKLQSGAWGCVFGPPPPPPPPGCQEVSVLGDATYCITGPQVCFGSGAAPSGSNCPKRGDRAVAGCRSNLPSYSQALSTPQNPVCLAPSDATCAKIQTGAWGCVFGTPPPVDCVFTWSYETCSKSCGGGTQTVTPIVSVWPANGGAACPTAFTQACNAQPCPGGPCNEMSVAGDATYCISGPICIGSGSVPAGWSCPKRGDRAIANCLSYLPSYSNQLSTPTSPVCIAPVDANCVKMWTGAWGCAYTSLGNRATALTASGEVEEQSAASSSATPWIIAFGVTAGLLALSLFTIGWMWKRQTLERQLPLFDPVSCESPEKTHFTTPGSIKAAEETQAL